KKTKKTVVGTIKKLDSKYPKYRAVNKPKPPIKEIEKVDAVDLDTLFVEKSKEEVVSEVTQDDNSALEDFLAGFNFDDEEEQIPETEIGYDLELYEKVINSKNILFDKSDILRIKSLLSSEIEENTIKSIDKYAVTCPIKDNPEKRIEDLITTFAVYQGINFNNDDLKTLKQLASVEIDPNFLSDLSVDKNRTKTMAKDIKKERPAPVTVEETTVLTVKDSLPDLSVEINNKAAYASKPSAQIEYADKSYEVSVLKVDVELPDLQDVLKNPEKYEDKPVKKAVVDENALLQGLSTVEFKPFDDGTREFEILNVFDDIEENAAEEQVLQPQIQTEQPVQKTIKSENKTVTATEETNLNCVFDGVSYTIISSIEYTAGVGFHLAKVGNGYAVLAYVDNNVNEIKHYDELKNERMNLRVSEILEDGTARCLLKVGYNKFVVDINGTSINHVMDL
ncbi:MAG: hypothetical protein MJ231_05645, partial [bacterium]|nr:hypothetical protein [bacterium]